MLCILHFLICQVRKIDQYGQQIMEGTVYEDETVVLRLHTRPDEKVCKVRDLICTFHKLTQKTSYVQSSSHTHTHNR